MSYDDNRDIGGALREFFSTIEKVSGKKLEDILPAIPTIKSQDIEERLLAGVLLIIVDKDREDEKVTISSAILVALLAEIYRWREMFGSIDLLKGHEN